MGDVSIIARRLEGGTRVQYGWSGNGGYFKMVGHRLLEWYNTPEKVEYLFGLGQMYLIGKPYSEYGGASMIKTNEPSGRPHWLGTSEREIFSKIAFVDYGYFYDLDHTWYYVIPGPFRIKVPLEYISRHLNEDMYEFDEETHLGYAVMEYILGAYYQSTPELHKIVEEHYPQGIEAIREDVLSAEFNACHRFWEKYQMIFDYFDDWVKIKTSADFERVTEIQVRQKKEEDRVETIEW